MITAEIARKLLHYNRHTGELIWRHRSLRWFPDKRARSIWNTRYAGKQFGRIMRNGYRRGQILGEHYSAHRLIVLMVTGRWPRAQVDHKNHDRLDNRWSNLREVSSKQNHRNMKLPKNNKSGRIGVQLKDGLFRAQIRVNRVTISLGMFPTMDEAAKARDAAERKYGFFVNHGRSANV